jgi:type I restriction-modification system DNA methylase subunit
VNEEKITGTEKEFLDVFRQLCISRSSWQVWADLMAAMACTLANAVDKSLPRHTAREKEYAECIKRLGGVEKPAKCFAIVVEALERNPDQDFLGKLYMSLELGNHWKGQFFTPYNVCECMAGITINDNMQTLEKQEWISVNDPACGAGATLVATANIFRRKKINYQTRVLFTANDIDRVVAQMCYIQLSLLGCAGWVAVANTISNPVCGDPLMPDEKPGQEFWYTPFYFREEWCRRRQLKIFREQFGALVVPLRKIEAERTTFYFDFEKGEYKCQNS